MKLTTAQRLKLCNLSGYIDGILEMECKQSGKDKGEYRDDPVYNALLSALAGIEEALEQDDLLVNMDL